MHAAVPREYMAQVKGQLEVLGRAWCDFVSWRQGRLLIVRVRRSAAYWAWLFGRLRRFWRGLGSGVDSQLEAIALEGGEQPPPVPTERAGAALVRALPPARAPSDKATWIGAGGSRSSYYDAAFPRLQGAQRSARSGAAGQARAKRAALPSWTRKLQADNCARRTTPWRDCPRPHRWHACASSAAAADLPSAVVTAAAAETVAAAAAAGLLHVGNVWLCSCVSRVVL